ncbi:hypothetical protein B0H14DRAFT_2929064 [Mycena olivaceomarginata]|nr:hypothetical protein B0H14DRAFT_2929064 [Mycena olivaceomarginata]
MGVNATRGWAGEVECARGWQGRVPSQSRRATTSRAGGHPQAQAYAPHATVCSRSHPIPTPSYNPSLTHSTAGHVRAATRCVEPAATAPAPAFPTPETGPAAPVAAGPGIAVCGAGVYVPTISGAARARARPKSKRKCKMRMGRTEIQRRRT